MDPFSQFLYGLPWGDTWSAWPWVVTEMFALSAMAYGLMQWVHPKGEPIRLTAAKTAWRMSLMFSVLLLISWALPTIPSMRVTLRTTFNIRNEFILLASLIAGWRGASTSIITSLLLRSFLPESPLRSLGDLLPPTVDFTIHAAVGLLIRQATLSQSDDTRMRPVLWAAALKQPTSLLSMAFITWVLGVPIPDGLLYARIMSIVTSPIAMIIMGSMILGEVRRRMAHEALREANQRLDQLSHTDLLTGLPNRRALVSSMHKLMHDQTPFAVLFADLDRFKPINDAFGHAAGDTVLRTVAQRINDAAPPRAACFRHGGDEFVVLIPDQGTPETLIVAAQKLRDAINLPLQWRGLEFSIGVSLGAAHADDPTASADELLHKADLAMFADKCAPDRSVGPVTVFHPQLRVAANEQVKLDTDLRRALNRGDLYMVFQPIFNTRTHRIESAEALLRWDHDGAAVSPDTFLRGSRRKDLGANIDLYATRQALGQWSSAGLHLTESSLSLNVSKFDLLHDSIERTFFDLLDRTGIQPNKVIFELTEHYLIENFDACRQAMTPFIDAGVRFALDDFGMGYSNLSYLSELPIDIIKVDKVFVESIHTQRVSVAVIHAAMELAECCGATVVAEGVENLLQLQQLQALGISHMQGFHLARPQSEHRLRDLLLRKAA